MRPYRPWDIGGLLFWLIGLSLYLLSGDFLVGITFWLMMALCWFGSFWIRWQLATSPVVLLSDE